MIFNVQTTGFKLTESLLCAVKEQTQQLRDYGRAPIGRLDIVLRDMHETKSGMDKCCRIQCKLNGHDLIVAHFVSDDMYAAIHQSFVRLQRSIDKAVRKKMVKHRHSQERLLAVVDDANTTLPQREAQRLPFDSIERLRIQPFKH
ncbi:MAG: HPF/RaiA family ribosome-associated protein [Gammaproteobacteria bacterium]